MTHDRSDALTAHGRLAARGPEDGAAQGRDAHSWWYRREFTLPAGALSAAGDGRLWLEAEGIGHAAELWLNGRPVGALPHPFARASYDVTESAGAAGRRPQVLAVRLSPTPHLSGTAPVAGARPPLRCPDASARLRNETPSARALAAELALAIRLRATSDASAVATARRAHAAGAPRGPLGSPAPDAAVTAGDALSRVVLAHRERASATGRITGAPPELRPRGVRFVWTPTGVLAGAAARDGGGPGPVAPALAASAARLAPAPVEFAWHEYATTVTLPGGAAPAVAPDRPAAEAAARPAPPQREGAAGGGHGGGTGGFGAGTGRAWWPADFPDDADTGLWGEGLPKAFVRAVEERMGAATSEEAFTRKARFVDYECLRAAAEAAALRPSPDTDVDVHVGRPEQAPAGWTDAGRFGALKAGGPLHVQADPADGTVTVVNRMAEPVRGATVTAQVYDLGGRPIGGPVTRTVDALPGLTPAAAVPFARSLPATHLLRLTVAGADGRVLSSNDYWRCRTPTDQRALNGLAQARLSLHTEPAGPGALTAEVTNTGGTPAALVRLSLGGRDTACADDNFLWLLPGESRRVTLTWTPDGKNDRAGDGRRPLVVAEAYNAPRTTA